MPFTLLFLFIDVNSGLHVSPVMCILAPKIYEMNRIFHARIAAGQYMFIAIASIVAVYALWEKHVLMALLFVLLLIGSIEKLIHTTYTITADGRLLLSFGRFVRGKEILLKDITSVERASSMRIGRFAWIRYVLVRYGAGKCVALLPVKEEEFIRALRVAEGRDG